MNTIVIILALMFIFSPLILLIGENIKIIIKVIKFIFAIVLSPFGTAGPLGMLISWSIITIISLIQILRHLYYGL